MPKHAALPHTDISPAEICRKLNVHSDKGLSRKEALHRLVEHGPNSLEMRSVSPWRIFFRQFKNAFVYLLIVSSLLALALGEVIDASIIFGFVIVNGLLGFFQEYRSERSVQLLRTFVVPTARVVRGGAEIEVPSSELVVGDIVLVRIGDLIPADVRFIAVDNLTIDESILTGESVAVAKTADALGVPAREAYQAHNLGFAQTVVVTGTGRAVVVATGARTQMGSLAKLTTETVRVSGFEKGLRTFSGFTLRMVLGAIVLMFAANIVLDGDKSSPLELVIFCIALAISVVPEAMPLVTTFSLSRGALRLARRKVVVKRLSSIEDLGSIEVLCTDKTGTLTENKLKIIDIFGDQREVLEFALLGNDRAQKHGGTIDGVIWHAASTRAHARARRVELVEELPFNPETRTSGAVMKERGRRLHVLRGAPEVLLKYLPQAQRHDAEQWAHHQGQLGRRVLAVVSEDGEKHFHGMISFADPLKATAKKAIAEAEELGVRVVVLTGDAPEVAGAIARECGLLESDEKILTGSELFDLSPEQRETALRTAKVFARVTPEEKYEIIQRLQKRHVVGFMGEGINDAPALKVANVAIAVREASDVAREAADIVLLDKSLHVVIDGIREGREVFVNTVKYVRSTITSNFGNFYAVVIASLLIPFLPMTATQILLVNLFTDFPMMALATDGVEKDELQTPQSYHLKEIVRLALVLGFVSTVFDLAYFGIFVSSGEVPLRTNWFIGSILTELLFLFSIRSNAPFFRASRPSTVIIAMSVVAAIAAIALPYSPLADWVGFQAPSSTDLAIIIGLAMAYFIVNEIAKALFFAVRNRKARVRVSV